MNEKLESALSAIDVSTLSYQEWINIGFALKAEGLSVSVWDEWSRNDPRYHAGECEQKWKTFNGSDTPVTGGTIIQMAKDRGWSYCPSDEPLDWNATLGGGDTGVIVRPSVQDFRKALEALFKGDECVGYTVESFQDKDGKWKPYGGIYNRTCSELLASLDHYPDDLGATIGDWKPDGGAWLRINPLDGMGIGNANVTAYRYALVESDTMPLEEQKRILLQYELPIATLTYSAGKSVHAVVKINAETLGQYKERVAFLYSFLEGKGFQIDGQNSNPSRLTRLPGATRSGKQQKLIGTNIGTKDWDDWQRALAANADDLPPIVSYSDYDNDSLEPPEALIDGVLMPGQKMIISGPSKAGKSILMMELCVAITEGVKWIGFNVQQGKVLYINLEIAARSCIRRIRKIYKAYGIAHPHGDNFKIWNLRGHATPLDKLVPKIIKQIKGQNYAAVILDPIYKLTMGGDENSATDMGLFCNQFDRICSETGAAVIYCHHHSKGAAGSKKVMDRASGSGVFARDPDAILDLSELEITDDIRNFVKDGHATAWRLECSLREFAPFKPINLWFEFPIHRVDNGTLENANVEGSWQANLSKSPKRVPISAKRADFEKAFNICFYDGGVGLTDIAEYMDVNERTIRRYISEFSDEYELHKGTITRIAKETGNENES